MIIYCFVQNAYDKLMDWSEHLRKNFEGVEITQQVEEGKLFFRTSHPCPNTGFSFKVRHEIIPLFFSPKK